MWTRFELLWKELEHFNTEMELLSNEAKVHSQYVCHNTLWNSEQKDVYQFTFHFLFDKCALTNQSRSQLKSLINIYLCLSLFSTKLMMQFTHLRLHVLGPHWLHNPAVLLALIFLEQDPLGSWPFPPHLRVSAHPPSLKGFPDCILCVGFPQKTPHTEAVS